MRPVKNPVPATPAERKPRIRQRLRTPLEAQQWRRRMAGYALYAAAFVLIVNALVGENGYLATIGARTEQDQVRRELAAVRHANQALQEAVERMKHDSAAVEEAARLKLNMIKPGEIQVVIRDKDQPQK